MIVSHKHRFIFVKTLKTAGTSIEVFLSSHCGDEDVVTPIIPPVPPHCPRNHLGLYNPLPAMRREGIRREFRRFRQRLKSRNHLPAHGIRRRIPRRVWNSYLKFCVERNPWDKTLSHYCWRVSRNLPELAGMSFDDYLKTDFLPSDLPRYSDPGNGDLIVDRVLKFESLSQDLSQVFAELGIPFNGDLGARAKSGIRNSGQHYREVFDDRQADIVRRKFAREIELFGYAF